VEVALTPNATANQKAVTLPRQAFTTHERIDSSFATQPWR
jgi:hypothetical protein